MLCIFSPCPTYYTLLYCALLCCIVLCSRYALQLCAKHLTAAVELGDPVAREQMCLAATAAGVGFGRLHLHLIAVLTITCSS